MARNSKRSTNLLKYVLSHNLNAILKRLVLESGHWEPKRMKAIRYHIINLPGRVIIHANQLWLRITGEGNLERLLLARKRILALAQGPPG